MEVAAYTADRRAEAIALALRTWAPIFPKTAAEVPRFVYDAFYPDGWEARQASDVGAMFDDAETECWLALSGDALIGLLGLRLHPEDRMGEIYLIAVDPAHQGQGIGRRLLTFGEARIREAGMAMVMVETVGDSGHAPARCAYEAAGYEPWPVARYFKPL